MLVDRDASTARLLAATFAGRAEGVDPGDERGEIPGLVEESFVRHVRLHLEPNVVSGHQGSAAAILSFTNVFEQDAAAPVG